MSTVASRPRSLTEFSPKYVISIGASLFRGPLHSVGRADPHQAKRTGDGGFSRLREHKPGRRQRGIVRDDAAVLVKAMHRGGHFVTVEGEPVRLQRFGCLTHD